MKMYVWVSFVFMGWGYYELSGGSDFQPEQQVLAVAEVDQQVVPDVVTRSNSTTLLSVSTSNVEAAPKLDSAAELIDVVSAAVAVADVEPVVPAVVEVMPEAAPVDIRQIAGSRVNMRMGPSTDYDVLTTLNSGTRLEVLDVNADGWANVSTVDRGIQGWVAERLLTGPET